MNKRFFFLFFLCVGSSLFSMCLKERWLEAKKGDYAAFLMEKNIIFLWIGSRSDSTVGLEEISIPYEIFQKQKMDYISWIEQKAPGHTAWNSYQIDLDRGKLLSVFSRAKKEVLVLDEANFSLPRLLFLPFQKLPLEEYKRIGPPPLKGEKDLRGLWLPSLWIRGKLIEKPKFIGWKGRWPKDASSFSEANLIIYMDEDRPFFPFPIWLELTNGHFFIKARLLDSGSNLNW
jgi:hypothetical protein